MLESSAHLAESPGGTLDERDFIKVMASLGPKIVQILKEEQQGKQSSNTFTVDEVMRFINNLTKPG